MGVLVSLPLNDGGHIVVEASEEPAAAGVVRAARPGEVVQEAGQTFEEALDRTLMPVANALMERLSKIKPQEAEVTLGLTLSAEAGVVFSKIAGEASFSVKLTWRTPEG